MASPGTATPAPRRRPPALWIWTACLSLLLFIDSVFSWEVNASGLGLVLTWTLPFAVAATFVWAVVFAFRRRRQWRMILAGVLAPMVCVAVWMAASQLAERRITWDFEHNYNARAQVVQMVLAGKLGIDPKRPQHDQFVALPSGSEHLAHWSGTILIKTDPQTDAVQQVWFYEERTCPECERGFVYSVSEEFDTGNGMYQARPLRPHWFWVVEVK